MADKNDDVLINDGIIPSRPKEEDSRPHIDDITPRFIEGSADIQRYNVWYTVGNATFFLDDYSLDEEEAKFILYKVLEQAVRDYSCLQWADVPFRDWHWHTAKDFLFEDGYFIQWGEEELNLEMICELLGLDIEWIRRKSKERYKLTIEKRRKKLEKKRRNRER